MKFAISFWSLLIAGAAASNVLELVPDNWDEVIGQGKPGLVELCVMLTAALATLADDIL